MQGIFPGMFPAANNQPVMSAFPFLAPAQSPMPVPVASGFNPMQMVAQPPVHHNPYPSLANPMGMPPQPSYPQANPLAMMNMGQQNHNVRGNGQINIRRR
jgi:hypothetical protein